MFFVFCFLMFSTVDMCNKQHLQTDLPDRQPRGNEQRPAPSAPQPFPQSEGNVHLLRLSVSSCGFLGGRHQVESDGSPSSDSHYKFWKKTRKLVPQVTEGQKKSSFCGAKLRIRNFAQVISSSQTTPGVVFSPILRKQ